MNLTYEDNYPTVNLEAQACGTKVISYDTGGAKETLWMRGSRLIQQGDLNTVRKIIGLERYEKKLSKESALKFLVVIIFFFSNCVELWCDFLWKQQ